MCHEDPLYGGSPVLGSEASGCLPNASSLRAGCSCREAICQPLLPSKHHSGEQCLLQVSPWVGQVFARPASWFDFCLILLPPLSLGRYWSLINIWHPKHCLSFCFWRTQPVKERHYVLCTSEVSSYRRFVQTNMLNYNFIAPKIFTRPHGET